MTELKYIEDTITGKKYKPDMEFRFKIAIPCVDVEEFALLIEHDGHVDASVNSLLRLADESKAPYCVSIGILPGNVTFPDGSKRKMRPNSYDLFDREYGDFVIFELLPYVKETYGIKISDNPDMHMVSGGSSGGFSAFVLAWFHPDFFHRIFLSSPSFMPMGRGDELLPLIRKCETKPFRIYEESSETEPEDYFGWNRHGADGARSSFEFANYDFKFEYFENEGHVSRYRKEDDAYIRNEWIWKDWQTEPIVAPANSPRVDKVIPFGSKWESCSAFPTAEKPTCDSLSKIYDNAVLSNDAQAWYTSNKNDDIVYLHINNGNFSADRRLTHAMLHTIPQQQIRGAIDMAVDRTDRLFVLTEMGIQCVRSAGLIDVILDLPDSTKPRKIAVTDALYVQTEKGLYKRALCADSVTDSDENRKCINYVD